MVRKAAAAAAYDGMRATEVDGRDRPWDTVLRGGAPRYHSLHSLRRWGPGSDEAVYEASGVEVPLRRWNGRAAMRGRGVLISAGARAKGTVILFERVVLGAGARVLGRTVVGRGSRISNSTVLCSGVTVGERTVVGHDCWVGHGVSIGDGTLIRPYAVIHGGYRRRTVIGDKVKVLPNVEIGSGAQIGSNSVIGVDIPAGCVVRPGSRLLPDSGLPAMPRGATASYK